MPANTIYNFFPRVTPTVKRAAESTRCSPSKRKLSDSSSNRTEVITSDGDSRKIEENKIKAQIKLHCKQTPALSPNIGLTWYTALKGEFNKPYFSKLSLFLEGERAKGTIYPQADQVFSWTNFCDINQIKVVILGQDPYHGPGQAHGLCFSVPKGIPVPSSLKNIYKELESDISGFTKPPHGNLIGWAEQGVLLLNAVLTVRAHNANSHKDLGWEQFTDAVVKWINQNCDGVVFLLWGAYAQKKGSFVSKAKHCVLSCPHPSGLSASRGFFGSKHFSKTNEYLKKMGKTPIDWAHLPNQ